MHLRRPSRSSSAQAHADERDADDDLLANYSQPVGPMVGPKKGWTILSHYYNELETIPGGQRVCS